MSEMTDEQSTNQSRHMTAQQYDATAPGQATKSFVKFMLSAMMIALGSEIGGIATNALGWFAELRAKKNPHAKRLADAVESHDRRHQAALRKGLLIIASWSAFEAWVEEWSRKQARNPLRRLVSCNPSPNRT